MRCGWFWAWAGVGVAGALGLISALGPIALGGAVLAGLAMSRSRTASRSALGLFAGAGVLSLFVCSSRMCGGIARAPLAGIRRADAISIATLFRDSVIPWLALGIVLVIGAVIAQTRHAG